MYVTALFILEKLHSGEELRKHGTMTIILYFFSQLSVAIVHNRYHDVAWYMVRPDSQLVPHLQLSIDPTTLDVGAITLKSPSLG